MEVGTQILSNFPVVELAVDQVHGVPEQDHIAVVATRIGGEHAALSIVVAYQLYVGMGAPDGDGVATGVFGCIEGGIGASK